MNTATKNLEEDHVHILRLIDVMEHITLTKNPDISHLESIVALIRNFADGLHHAKEENLFFPFLEERGFSSTRGPVAVMLNEHEQGRSFVKGISDNIVLYKKGNKAVLAEIYYNMTCYVDLLRNHIGKENNILFKMADKVLSETDHSNLLGKFKEAAKAHTSTLSAEDYIKSINLLVSHYKI